MASEKTGGLLAVRPALTRTRSNTTPTATTPTPLEPGDGLGHGHGAARPSHTRSQSYISPVASKTVNAEVGPTHDENSSESSRLRDKLHLSGKHHGHAQHEEPKKRHGRHRYTQSAAQQYHRRAPSKRRHGPDEQLNDTLYPSSRGAAIPSLKRMTSARPDRNQTPVSDGGQRRHLQNSDPVSSEAPMTDRHLQRINPIVLELERGDRRRRTARLKTTEADVQQIEKQLSSARAELTERLQSNTRTTSSLLRRLDQAHDTLHRTTESLLDTISSFANLLSQSSRLIHKFQDETAELDTTTRQRIDRFQTQFCDRRGERILHLESRGRDLSRKAEDLGRRLENCRRIVKNWESRERSKRKAWKGVYTGVFWSFVLIFIGVAAGVVSWKAMELHHAKGTPARNLAVLMDNQTFSTAVLYANPDPHDPMYAHSRGQLPDDVKDILREIRTRNRGQTRLGLHQMDISEGVARSAPSTSLPASGSHEDEDQVEHPDERLAILDDL